MEMVRFWRAVAVYKAVKHKEQRVKNSRGPYGAGFGVAVFLQRDLDARG